MKSVVTVIVSWIMFSVVSGGGVVSAGVGSKVISETTEYVMKTFTREATEEGAEKIAKQVTKIAAKYGDEGLDAVRKVGPRGIKVIQEAGENGLGAVKLINRYGDDAVWVISKPKGMAIFVKYGDDGAKALIKHKGVAEEVIEAHGKSAVGALNAVGTQQARQIAMLQKDGIIRAGEQGDKLLDVVIRYGDKAMAFIWRNKAALAVTAGLGTFVANPEGYIEGGKDLVVEGLAGPATEMGKEMARNTNWTVLGLAGIAVLGGLQGLRMWMQRQKDAPRAAA